MEKVQVNAGGKTYEILIEHGLLKRLPVLLAEKFKGKKLAIVSDSMVYPLFGECLVRELLHLGAETIPIVFEAGEANKNLATLTDIYSRLAENAFTRSDVIIALGGGVTGDMAGLAAATFLRGMGFVQIPTTLLAMVDSSIGGKVAVDLPQGKNLVGAFYQPDAVYTDPALLESLTDRQFSDGFAELLKHSFIRDAELFELLTGFDCYPRKALSGRMEGIIARSCQIKRDVVEEDERDNAIRQLLNFGHTIGHAIERIQNFTGYSHGEAVSIGMIAITRLTEKLGLTRRGETERLSRALSLYQLPTKMPDVSCHDLMAAIRLDKKTRSGRITLAFIEEIGAGKLFTLELDALEDNLREIYPAYFKHDIARNDAANLYVKSPRGVDHDNLRIKPAPLRGTVLAQPSKSMAHRAIICAALACGTSKVDNVVLSDDITATIGAVQALGAEVAIDQSIAFPGRKTITITSKGKITSKNSMIDCLESGSTARFIMPITRLVSDKITLTGRGRLVERPFDLYRELFAQKGIEYSDQAGKMPITLSGQLDAGEYTLPGDVSSQFISGLLFALPLLEGDSKILVTNKLESLPYIKMTLQALHDFGIVIKASEDFRSFFIKGGQSFQPLSHYMVEGDWSQAAFFCVMGVQSEGITLKGLREDSLQGDKVILDILKRMGANYEVDAEGITFRQSDLKGTNIDVSQCPDLVPAIAAAASLANGFTYIQNAARLRIKESDRLFTTRRELNALGAKITEEPEGLIIEGVNKLFGNRVSGCGDHRIVMALASISPACEGVIELEGSSAVKKSYPEFWDDFKLLGGRLEAV